MKLSCLPWLLSLKTLFCNCLIGQCMYFLSILVYMVAFYCRCFGLIDDTQLEQIAALDRLVSTNQNLNHEAIMGLGLSGCVYIVLNQCSPQIYQVNIFIYSMTYISSQVWYKQLACTFIGIYSRESRTRQWLTFDNANGYCWTSLSNTNVQLFL